MWTRPSRARVARWFTPAPPGPTSAWRSAPSAILSIPGSTSSCTPPAGSNASSGSTSVRPRPRSSRSQAGGAVVRFTEYREVLRRIGEARHILAEGGDRELAELAQAEIDELTGRESALEEELKRLLVPRDPNDEKNVFLEIRAGAGGDEAALFASELVRMYTKYAERQRWRVEVMDTTVTGVGGLKDAILFVQGRGAR